MNGDSGRLRIIGGAYRGRKLPVPNQPGLRPTADRVRETLFNWLQPVIEGARCLDLFAGSGAIGFEAASRGAGEVVMIERSLALARSLDDNAVTLGARQVRVLRADALDWLAAHAKPFDIAFLDPPFADGLLGPSLGLLVSNGWLAPRAYIYLETSAKQGFPPLPGGWRLTRDKRAGQVRYALAEASRESRESG